MDRISEVIRGRRSIFPKQFNQGGIDESDLKEILENANWAPTHKRTEPWRFKIIRGKGLERFSGFLGEKYKELHSESFSDTKYQKQLEKPLLADVILAICMQRDPDTRIPVWEELAAVACAVQNIWLTAAAKGIGAYWSSPVYKDFFSEFYHLDEGERCLGFFYMGKAEQTLGEGRRSPIKDKLVWIED